jgi:hypothetical protein
MTQPSSTTRSIFKPIIAGVLLIAALFLIIAFRNQLGDLVSRSGSKGGSSLLSWIPNHKGATTIIIAAFIVFLGIDYVAHLAGRLRAWIFVVVVQIGLWILFWNNLGITPLKDFLGLKDTTISGKAQIVSLLIIMVLSGVVFWILEAKEAFDMRRHRTGGDD